MDSQTCLIKLNADAYVYNLFGMMFRCFFEHQEQNLCWKLWIARGIYTPYGQRQKLRQSVLRIHLLSDTLYICFKPKVNIQSGTHRIPPISNHFAWLYVLGCFGLVHLQKSLCPDRKSAVWIIWVHGIISEKLRLSARKITHWLSEMMDGPLPPLSTGSYTTHCIPLSHPSQMCVPVQGARLQILCHLGPSLMGKKKQNAKWGASSRIMLVVYQYIL